MEASGDSATRMACSLARCVMLSMWLVRLLSQLDCCSLIAGSWSSVPAAPSSFTRSPRCLSYFTRGSILEHLHFATRTVIQRTKAGTRQTVGLSENPFLVHTYVRYDGLAGIVVTQKDYAVRVAYSLINKMMADYEAAYPDAWKKCTSDTACEPESMKKDM